MAWWNICSIYFYVLIIQKTNGLYYFESCKNAMVNDLIVIVQKLEVWFVVHLLFDLCYCMFQTFIIYPLSIFIDRWLHCPYFCDHTIVSYSDNSPLGINLSWIYDIIHNTISKEDDNWHILWFDNYVHESFSPPPPPKKAYQILTKHVKLKKFLPKV